MDLCFCHRIHILALLLLIMDISVSNLGPEARYPVSAFSWFSLFSETYYDKVKI
jgi:hypothetical protein